MCSKLLILELSYYNTKQSIARQFLTEVFLCFFLGCKANTRVKLAKTGHGPHSSNCCVVLRIVCFVSFYVLFVCKCVVLPPGDNPIAVNKCINNARQVGYGASKC